MRRGLTHTYDNIISIDNLLEAWKKFLKGKRAKRDVQEFQYRLFDNIFALHFELKNKTYIHGGYHAFNISDPKPRNIHKASVRDRLLHHALYIILYPFFDKTFIADSYSCRKGKGTHKGMIKFCEYFYKVSKNNTKTAWVLQCDIKKFFANIDHGILLNILKEYISDKDIIGLVNQVVKSFHSLRYNTGLPLGNLTSQLLVNVYMNEFDQFVKHKLKARYYIRYADDFVIFSQNRDWLKKLVPRIQMFLAGKLHLELHPKKISIKTITSGVDFLGWVHFPDHRVLRTTTKRRMMKRIIEHPKKETVQSYLGLLSHGNTGKLENMIKVCSKVDFNLWRG